MASLREGENVVPKIEAVEHMLENVPRHLQDLFSCIRLSAASEQPLVLSQHANAERIQLFGNRMKRIAQGTKQNIVAVVGAHAAPRYAAAVSEALCRNDMDIRCKDSEEASGQRSVLLACARSTPYEYPTDAQDAMNDAVLLAAMPEMRGRAGLLFHGKVFALPGLQRKGEPSEFDSRFPTIAHRDDESGTWYFSERTDAHVPHGECDAKFVLDSGVEHFDIRGEHPEAALAAIRTAAEGGKLKGMVLQTESRAGGHLREDNQGVLGQLDTLGIPGIVVCDTLHRAGNGHRTNGQNLAYSRLFDGKGLLPEEAQILLSRWVAQARGVGIEETDPLVAYIHQKLSTYEFA